MRALIQGWGTAAPEGRLTNADLESQVDTTGAWIVERTGIRERRVAAPDECTSLLAAAAASDAIKHAGITPDDVDLLVVATLTPDQPMPHTGAFVGERLGLRCGSFDLAAACAGFVYGVVVGNGMLNAGFDHVLVVGAETLSRFTDPTDRATCILFGDGAGAAVLARADPESRCGLLAWEVGCDGSGASLLQIPAGGSRRPPTVDTVERGDHYIKMEGREVFRRAVRVVVESAGETLRRAEMTADEVDWFVPHQANARIIEAAAARLGISKERTVVNIDRYGNTSSASIPLALFEAADDGRIGDGDIVLLSGFGAGMTWGSVLLRWGRK